MSEDQPGREGQSTSRSRRSRRVGPFTVYRTHPAVRRSWSRTKVLASLTSFLTIFHEVIYRQTGGDDYPLFGLVSHAGSDLILMGMAVVAASILMERKER